MSKRTPGKETDESSISNSTGTWHGDELVASADGLTPVEVGYYQTTISPHVTASTSIINSVQRDQTNNYNYNSTHIYHDSSNSDRRDKIRQWLSPTIPSTSYGEALEMRLQETGKWIMEDKRFSEWKENADSLLWLYGKPGSGKTVLSSSIIEDVSQQCNGSATMAYGYFFFDGRDSQKGLQLDHLIISLIWQFSKQFSEQYGTMPKPLDDLYDTRSSSSEPPLTVSLHETLLLILNNVDHAYLIVDALDECTEQNKLLKWIDEISRWKVGKLHLLATSRPEPDIRKALRLLDPILIGLEGKFVDRDITSYLDWMLRDDEKLKEWDQDTQYKIKTSLLQGAQGMFRWVALQLYELRCCRSRHQIEEQLDCLPNDLKESYDRIIHRINKRDREDALKLFQWLAFSIRPLELAELAEVVAVDFQSRDLPWFNRRRQYNDLDGILEVCSGFVSVTEGRVKIAHFSVKEYFLKQSAPPFHLTEKNSHLHISKTCLAYLAQFDGPESLDIDCLQDYPLARYAAEYWISHAKFGDFDNTLHHQKLAINIFHNSDMLLNWIQIWDIDEPSLNLDPNDLFSESPIPSALYYASRAGLEVAVRSLLKAGADVNAQGGWCGSALQAAALYGHDLIVKILLENHAHVDLLRGYGTALQVASFAGHEAIVKILLENGANVNAMAWPYNALQMATLNGHEAIVNILLQNGADVDAQGRKFHGNALQLAASRGNEGIVKILLKNGADVNAHGGMFNSNALLEAASNGYEGIVNILLENGADVNSQGGMYGNALLAASYMHRDVIVKILLKNGASVDAQEGWDGGVQDHEAFHIVKHFLEETASVFAP